MTEQQTPKVQLRLVLKKCVKCGTKFASTSLSRELLCKNCHADRKVLAYHNQTMEWFYALPWYKRMYIALRKKVIN